VRAVKEVKERLRSNKRKRLPLLRDAVQEAENEVIIKLLNIIKTY